MINFSIQEMQDRVIFGIPLYDTQGNPFPDDLLQSYLDSSIAWAEQTLNIVIQPREEEEHHDYLVSDYMNWNFLKLWKKPILDIESIEMIYGESRMFQIPNDWLKIDKLAGTVQIFPISGSAGGLIINAGGGAWTPMLHGRLGYAPQMWRVKYRAGMENPTEKQVTRTTTIHPTLKDLIYRKTAMGVLGVWGDLIIGAGIANQSVGIDGLSQSIGTTQSPMFGGASARIAQLKEDVETMLPALRSYYGGIDMTVI